MRKRIRSRGGICWGCEGSFPLHAVPFDCPSTRMVTTARAVTHRKPPASVARQRQLRLAPPARRNLGPRRAGQRLRLDDTLRCLARRLAGRRAAVKPTTADGDPARGARRRLWHRLGARPLQRVPLVRRPTRQHPARTQRARPQVLVDTGSPGIGAAVLTIGVGGDGRSRCRDVDRVRAWFLGVSQDHDCTRYWYRGPKTLAAHSILGLPLESTHGSPASARQSRQ